PDYLRRLCWEPPVPATTEAISAFLREKGARPWQIALVSGPLARAFVDAHQSENPATAEES
ncbi:MAG: ribonuclease D, partial [Pontimonas sp.]